MTSASRAKPDRLMNRSDWAAIRKANAESRARAILVRWVQLGGARGAARDISHDYSCSISTVYRALGRIIPENDAVSVLTDGLSVTSPRAGPAAAEHSPRNSVTKRKLAARRQARLRAAQKAQRAAQRAALLAEMLPRLVDPELLARAQLAAVADDRAFHKEQAALDGPLLRSLAKDRALDVQQTPAKQLSHISCTEEKQP